MKTIRLLLTIALAVLFAMPAFAGDEETAGKPHVVRAGMTTATATVVAIDLDKRVVTLKGADGDVFDLTVGSEAKNLPQVKVGDRVTATYYEAISAKVYKPGEGPEYSGASEETLKTAKPGEKPSGELRTSVTAKATVTAIDTKGQSVTLKGMDGKSIKVRVEDPANLKGVVVGDEVIINYEQALAISVDAAK